MHILNCQYPKRIFNKYTKEFQYVPCGKCPQCLKSRANKWIERLNVERKCWKYCLFFTLTYSEDYVPRLEKLGDDYLVDLTHLHQADDTPSPVIDLNKIYFNLSPERRQKLKSYLDSQDSFTYLSVYDVQCFVKRVRKNLDTIIKLNYKDYEEKDTHIRYYIIGEYGSTTFRSHYHGLFFFSSEKQKTYIEEVLFKSWKFGIVDTSFVSDSNASYLAKYLNCYSGLPEIYEAKGIRQFSVFSKEPPIGTLYFNEEKIRKLFDSCSPRMCVDYIKGLSTVDVPMWKTFECRLFPKLSGFSRFSHFDRVKLYRATLYFAEQYQINFSAADFARYMLGHHQVGDDGQPFYGRRYLYLYEDYIQYLSENSEDLFGSLIRWCGISRRVCVQAAAFDMSIEQYVRHIEKYYNNKEQDKLKLQYNFQSVFADTYNTRSLLGIDKLYLESILDKPASDYSLDEIDVLRGYGIDFEKFTSDDLSERLQYQSEILPENTRDYWNMTVDSANWLKKYTKTKVKNDYLRSHPELQNSFNQFKK